MFRTKAKRKAADILRELFGCVKIDKLHREYKMSWGSVNAFHVYATVGVGVCSVSLMFLIRDPKTPKWLDVAVAITLLLLAALFLGLVQSIFNVLPEDTISDRDLKSEYQVALYVIPFFTAGLATNLLSNIILNQRDYTDTMSFYEAARRATWFIWIAFLTSTFVGLLLYVGYKQIEKWSINR
ncbi:hypothetical protein HU811_01350 [Pseudomonas sp. SWRI196]|uniref:Uncharacterized protein n=1 Tax=Pseudomonas tehranensis TaxID=2745502 RepID=A0ABR6UL50_9PSED|nr:hypothetical protein [Pseudomonas tehranensis]MBC3345279.1 hypothetical protein [Pseudomonas tehranensis]